MSHRTQVKRLHIGARGKQKTLLKSKRPISQFGKVSLKTFLFCTSSLAGLTLRDYNAITEVSLSLYTVLIYSLMDDILGF